MATIPQPSMSGGELAPSLHGRVDLERYQVSLKTCRNFVPQAYGGVKNRQGSRFSTQAYAAGTTSRLVPFSFNADQSYVLELVGGTTLGPTISTWTGTMRIFTNGRVVGYDAEEVARQSGAVTINTPVEVDIPWLIGDVRDLKFSQSGDVMTVTHGAYAPMQIVRYATAWWGVRALPGEDGPWQSQNVNKGVVVSVSDVVGSVTVTANAPIFTGRVGMMFQITQFNLGKPWEVSSTLTGDPSVSAVIRRVGTRYYRALTALNYTAQTGTVAPTHTEGVASDGKTTWEYLHNGTGWGTITAVAADGASATLLVPANGRLPEGVAGASVSSGVGISIATVTRSSTSRQLAVITTSSEHEFIQGTYFKFNLTIHWYSDGVPEDVSYSALSGWVTGTTTVAFGGVGDPVETMTLVPNTDSTISLALEITSSFVAPTYRWAFGAWGGDQGWPLCSAYHQQRHCFGGSPGQPQTVWMSRTGDYKNFGTSSPLKDDDSITFTLASAKIDIIESMLSMDRLALFTPGGNWVTASGQDDALSPVNLAVKLQNYYGSSTLPPLGVGSTSLYYGKGGTVRDMAYDYVNDSYVGNDITVAANHLFNGRAILEWDFQTAPFPIIWAVRDDGVLLSCTYLREEKVAGWARHDLSGTVESVCVINECGEDHVYLAIKRTINGSTVRHIDVMYARSDDELESCFADAAVTYDGRNTASTTVTVTSGTYAAGSAATITASAATFQNAVSEAGDQIVLESPAGTYFRLTLGSGTSGTTVRAATIGSTALPTVLQATAQTAWAFARRTFTGLTHLTSTPVVVLSDGEAAVGTVSAGNVLTLADCTPALVPGFVITAGLPIVAELEPLSVVTPGQQGPLMETSKMISTVRLMVENSRSCYVGNSSATTYEATLKTAEDTNTLVTQGDGIIEVTVGSTWNRNGVFYLKHTKPYPLSIIALLSEVEAGT